MRTERLLALVLLAAAAAPSAARAQMRYDAASGDYFVTVLDDRRQPVEMRVVPMNKVDVAVSAATAWSSATTVRYQYRVRVLEGSRQPLAFFEVDCAPGTASLLSASGSAGGSVSTWEAGFYDPPGRSSCSFETGSAFLPAGGILTAELESRLLPQFGEVRVFGYPNAPVVWPTVDPIPENEGARELVDQVSGLRGGWKAVPAVIPGRDPLEMRDPVSGSGLLLRDVQRACELGWIQPSGLCVGFTTKLRIAQSSALSGRTAAALNILEAFRNALDAQRGEGVSEQAYALLALNTDALIDAMGGTSARPQSQRSVPASPRTFRPRP